MSALYDALCDLSKARDERNAAAALEHAPVVLQGQLAPGIEERDPQHRALRRVITALAGCVYTLRCQYLRGVHPDSSIAHDYEEGVEALAGVGVTWCGQRGWIQDVRPAGAARMLDEDIDSPERIATRARRCAEVLEAGREMSVDRVIAALRDAERALSRKVPQ